MTSVFPIFYLYEHDSGKIDSIQFLQDSERKYSSQELIENATEVIMDFSKEFDQLEAKRIALQAEIDVQRKEIDQKIQAEEERKSAMKFFSAKGDNVVANTLPKFQIPISTRKIRSLEAKSKGLDSKQSPLNEKQVALLKDNPIHFCDEKHVYVDLAVSWQTSANEDAYQSRIFTETGIHHGILMRIPLNDPALNAPEIQSAIEKLKKLH